MTMCRREDQGVRLVNGQVQSSSVSPPLVACARRKRHRSNRAAEAGRIRLAPVTDSGGSLVGWTRARLRIG